MISDHYRSMVAMPRRRDRCARPVSRVDCDRRCRRRRWRPSLIDDDRCVDCCTLRQQIQTHHCPMCVCVIHFVDTHTQRLITYFADEQVCQYISTIGKRRRRASTACTIFTITIMILKHADSERTRVGRCARVSWPRIAVDQQPSAARRDLET